MSLKKNSRIFVAGHSGMVGSAICAALKRAGYGSLVTATRAELNLISQVAVLSFLKKVKADCVIIAAAKVGGINANDTYPADFIYENLMIEANLIHGSWQAGVHRLLFLGSSCIYPRQANQPIRESALLTGPLEPTNESYAIAKIAGIKLCESYNRQHGTDYRSVMPTNLYGPNDNFHPENSHVIPALLRRFHEAKLLGEPAVTVWGSGQASREFLHVDDMASGCLHVLDLSHKVYADATEPMLSHLNVGTGEDLTIAELATSVKSVVGYKGELRFDLGKPDGAPRKLLDVSKLKALGWQPSVKLVDGLEQTYRWFLSHQDNYRQ